MSSSDNVWTNLEFTREELDLLLEIEQHFGFQLRSQAGSDV